jgi:tagaturonate epimerase
MVRPWRAEIFALPFMFFCVFLRLFLRLTPQVLSTIEGQLVRLTMLSIEPYTFGIGDRFARQGRAQLQAIILARQNGIDVYPVWNKSNREHAMIKSSPDDVRAEAESAVKALNWTSSFYVDADHINLRTVDGFAHASNFFTIDVADFVGQTPEMDAVEGLVKAARKFPQNLSIPGVDGRFAINEAAVREAASKFLLPIQEAGRIYRRIVDLKGVDNFVTEISIDETDRPQSPIELFLILLMISEQLIPVQTIAPKFAGRFNKGIDYAGDLSQFEKEFDEDLAVIRFAVREFGLPTTLKLSVHSGSDKFSLYPIINRLVKKHEAGLHLKTAGTTWLEEIVGLAESGGEGLGIAKEIYTTAFNRFDELKAPYVPVIDIDAGRLPDPKAVASWSAEEYANALRHVESSPGYNPHFRQLIHIAFRVAAEMGTRFLEAVKANETTVARNVKENLWDRHIRPIFG